MAPRIRQALAPVIVCLFLVWATIPFPARAADPDAEKAPPAGPGKTKSSGPTRPKSIGDFNEVTPQLRAAVSKGLDYLANGVLSSPDGSAGSANPVAVTGLTGLAFLSNGETPTRGPHALALKRCLQYIVGHTSLTNGLISSDGRSSLMYSHGFATLFLAQAYGTTRSIRLRRAVRAAVRLIEDTQGPGGGWSYQPVAQGRNDMSIGVCQTMALRAARNAGVAVSAEVIRKAIECTVRARSMVKVNRNGKLSFAYTSNRPGQGGSLAVTSGSLCILYGLGVYEDNGKDNPQENPGILIRPAQNFVISQLPNLRRSRGFGQNYYAHYYSSQAMAQAGGAKYWGRWFPPLRDSLLALRRGQGYWSGGVSSYYCTAMAVLILTVPYQYLPILNQ